MQALIATQLQDDLEYTEAAQLARANQQKCTHQSVQKGGVMYASQARAMVQQQDENNTEKRILQVECQLERLHKSQVAEKK
ncbi:hypothetical protein L873DRAFT_1808268 [Choiromyces venosus 120613-1]|uniref:Uncharacterized protein n=1 Tax=Choiromyces venosus 120613-1 TaxID=1336337 RepID=A0A3N4JJ95_9PEZI|nr:hypothetical protein L873DRAFT_1808268 [Choiromyces venosus 120613-1]